MDIGIYKISSILKPERIYIGSTSKIKARFIKHRVLLKNGNHHSIILQNHVNKYGINDLRFEIIENCDKNELLMKEQIYLNSLNPYFNVCKLARSVLGIKRSEAFKHRISESKKGHFVSEETKKKIGLKSKGQKKHSEEWKKILSEKMKGNKYGVGKTHSKERKKIHSDRMKGERHPNYGKKFSKEVRMKMSEGQKEKVLPMETRIKIGNANRGKKVSEKGKENMIKAWEKRKLKKQAL